MSDRTPIRDTPRKLCGIEGCGRPFLAHGLCSLHYARVRRYGSPLIARKDTLAKRFWLHVTPAGPNDCWEWKGSRHKQGYGMIRHNGKTIKGHRASWMIHNGPIPPGQVVRHDCDNPPCCNPNHLRLGTQRQNIQDAIDRGIWRKATGERNGNARLTDAQATEIARRYRHGSVTQKDLAAEFGVSVDAVRYAIRHRGEPRV